MVKDKPKDTFYDHYTQSKPTGLGNWLVNRTSRRIFDFAQITKTSSVLEIGPGRGSFAAICLEKGIEYWAVEPNEKMAQPLKEQGINVIQQMVPPLKDIGENFDVVVMNNVLEHMNTMTDALNISQDIYNLLNPGGRFVIYSPDYANFRYLFFLNDFSHNYITTWKRIEGLLISAGYKNIKAKYCNALFKNATCLITSGLAAWLPFGRLSSLLPNNKLISKLYKLQCPFLRRILISGTKQS